MRKGTEDEAAAEAEEEEEEDGRGIASGLFNLNIVMGATEEEAAEGLAEALGMEVEEDVGIKGGEGGGGTQRAMEAFIEVRHG